MRPVVSDWIWEIIVSSDDFITETRAANASTVTVNAGDGSNTVNLTDFAGATSITTGVGNDSADPSTRSR